MQLKKDKYYTNIICVFNSWKKKHLKDSRKEAYINYKLENTNKRLKEKLKKKNKKIN